jgi:hypothetical protein
VTPAERRAALATEADRIKARLDQLDRQLSGDPDAWLSIVQRMPDTVAEVMVDKALAEARQQALALATIVKTLDGAAGQQDAPSGPATDPGDEVAKARQAKLEKAQAAGE